MAVPLGVVKDHRRLSRILTTQADMMTISDDGMNMQTAINSGLSIHKGAYRFGECSRLRKARELNACIMLCDLWPRHEYFNPKLHENVIKKNYTKYA